MKTNERLIQAAILAAGIAASGFFVKEGIGNYAEKDRTVTVKGLAEREVEADKVTWAIPTKELGNDLPELYGRIRATTDKVIAFLRQNGIKDREISVNAPVVIDLNADRYSTNANGYRYNVTSVITVTSGNVKLVRGIMARQGELLKQGVAVVDGGYQNAPQYEYVAFRKMKPAMMKEAIKNARTTAGQFAESSNSSIGKIHTAGQGQFSIEDRDRNTPYIKKLRVVTTVTYALED
ncbi:MAG: SIMPL domain-containing protein [Bacteroidales bacterium]|nr:SIMPL domain-containing protein [Bacteroidales bacterium]MCM1147792.1 SIMPL domain-containing protein [Bacteroidales bacterium]MCM1206440.1 SIMPL domain-containing protein [Bacillota bacterium]MCM1510324.1 SIMPL domain-containing protein [Clostridium sp.]